MTRRQIAAEVAQIARDWMLKPCDPKDFDHCWFFFDFGQIEVFGVTRLEHPVARNLGNLSS